MKQVHMCAMQSDSAGIYVSYHCVSMCMFVQSVGTDNRPLSLCILFFSCGLTHSYTPTLTDTHTSHLHTVPPGFRQVTTV